MLLFKENPSIRDKNDHNPLTANRKIPLEEFSSIGNLISI